ncbi:glycosyltransferase family 2 protein [Cohnella abietis]|uniref:Glycosyl transferase family 2 n=1 Tax=Cohnella abietis TaxID=2507935 RepID=A0A3T1DA70_9BACL|nr:glycosyltransferase [Cohnella abietis]BBI35002.1 glycosyl transferase family 2 [Cohnella abietis]
MANGNGLPLVSVIIPFYNCPFIDQSIASVLNQTYPNTEIVVVDDGSTLHQNKLENFRSRIHYFGKANGGTGSALNYGLRVASGDYFVWLSSDDLMYPQKIERQVAFMQQHKALISCTDFHLINEYSEITMRALAVKFPSLRKLIEALFTFCPINGSTVMMHRSLPSKVGYFNESLACTQDYEYWLRVHLARVDFYFINEVLTLYRWHEGMGSVQKKAVVDHEFNLVRDRYAPQMHAMLNLL